MTSIIKSIIPIGFSWETKNPFLFCVHHQDAYPKGNGKMGPVDSLAGRNIGQDFDMRADWRMYHGHQVPGFPEHPHRGFETITIVLEGFVDHFDSSGATGRYGQGDIQWMTAGSGLQHSEMFPLVYTDKPNPLDLFQIWINLPKANKFVEPYYKMLWAEDIPIVSSKDANGRLTSTRIIAGDLNGKKALESPPNSWAHTTKNQVAIWLITMNLEANFTFPAAKERTNRSLFFFEGSSISIGDQKISSYHKVDVHSNKPVNIKNGSEITRILLLQGNPINEPIAQYGPFVMNTHEEIQQAYDDFRRTRFGGWPWDRNDPVHSESKGRFAHYHDGKIEERGKDNITK